MNEITIDELKKLDASTYVLVDIREEEKVLKNPIDHSVVLSMDEVEKYAFDRDKKIVVVCDRGKLSIPVVLALCNQGYDAVSLHGGYVSIVMDKMKENNSIQFAEKAERSIIKTYRKQIWSKFTKAVRDYELIKEGIGLRFVFWRKDSMLMAK